jgi:glucose/arabinose dehydrogenase
LSADNVIHGYNALSRNTIMMRATRRLTAITGGSVYRGSTIPALIGQHIPGDMVTRRVFHVPVADLRLGAQSTLKELTLLQKGVETTLLAIAGVGDRVDLRFGQDELEEIYVLTKQDGKIRRLDPAAV